MRDLTTDLGFKKLVRRSQRKNYNRNIVLTTNVNLLSGFNDFVALMHSAASTSPTAWFLQYHTRAFKPEEIVRVVPSVLNGFNTSRILRRASVSGLRMCNLYSRGNASYYITDILLSCTFDAIAMASAIADFAKLGTRCYASFSVPRSHSCKADLVTLADKLTAQFWRSSGLPRHAAIVQHSYENLPFSFTLIFESNTLSLPALLQHICDAFHSVKDLSYIAIGRDNDMLRLSRKDLIDESLYNVFDPDKLFASCRYRNFSAFGKFYRNPNYQFYK